MPLEGTPLPLSLSPSQVSVPFPPPPVLDNSIQPLEAFKHSFKPKGHKVLLVCSQLCTFFSFPVPGKKKVFPVLCAFPVPFHCFLRGTPWRYEGLLPYHIPYHVPFSQTALKCISVSHQTVQVEKRQNLAGERKILAFTLTLWKEWEA